VVEVAPVVAPNREKVRGRRRWLDDTAAAAAAAAEPGGGGVTGKGELLPGSGLPAGMPPLAAASALTPDWLQPDGAGVVATSLQAVALEVWACAMLRATEPRREGLQCCSEATTSSLQDDGLHTKRRTCRCGGWGRDSWASSSQNSRASYPGTG
jgi:hypothetical protein